MSTTNPKARHYTTQLRTALCAGSFASPNPAHLPNSPGTASVSWPELIRKHTKHCTAAKEDAHERVVATACRDLALLIGAGGTSGDVDERAVDGDGVWEDEQELTLREEGKLVPERREEARKAGEALGGLEGHRSALLTKAWYAYALSKPDECIQLLSTIPELPSSAMPALPVPHAPSMTASLSVPPTNGRASTPSHGRRASISISEPVGITDGSTWRAIEVIRSLNIFGMSHEQKHDKTSALQHYLSALPLIFALTSSIPRDQPSGPSTSINATNTIPTPPPSTAFTRYRELWRWTELLLRRAVILLAGSLSSPGPSSLDDTMPISVRREQLVSLFQLYTTLPLPPSFRPARRAVVYRLHLHVLIQAGHLLHPPVVSSAASISSSTTSAIVDLPPPWLGPARMTISELRAVLDASMTFPRADERNKPVLDFVDLTVAVWDAAGAREGGGGAGWVVDILWWATRLTFNAPRVLRHQARLLEAAGDEELARRFGRLYVQVVDKAKQAAAADAPASSSSATEAHVNGHGENVKVAATPQAEDGERGEGQNHVHPEDVDDDVQYVMTCVRSARMLARMAMERAGVSSGRSVGTSGTVGAGGKSADEGRGMKFVREAGEMVKAARTRLKAPVVRKEEEVDQAGSPMERAVRAVKRAASASVSAVLWTSATGEEEEEDREESVWKELSASVDLAESVVEVVFALIEQIPSTRPNRIARSLELAQSSLGKYESHDGWHHTAILRSLPGPQHSLEAAESAAARAIELAPDEVRTWHLLGIVVSAKGEEKKARGVLEAAFAVAEAVLGSTSGGGGAQDQGDTQGVKAKDFGQVDGLPSRESSTVSADPEGNTEDEVLLPENASVLPSAHSLLPIGAPTLPRPSRAARVTQATQIRMTLLVLAERLDGAENGGDGWMDAFAWFAARSGSANGHGSGGGAPSIMNGAKSERTMGGHPRGSADTSVPGHTGVALGTSLGRDAEQSIQGGSIMAVPINVTPASPTNEDMPRIGSIMGPPDERSGASDEKYGNGDALEGEDDGMEHDDESHRNLSQGPKRVKKVQRMVKKSMHASQARIGTITRRIEREVRRGSGASSIRRSRSVSDLQPPPFQASSIHTRRFYAPSVAGTRPSSPGTDTISAVGPPSSAGDHSTVSPGLPVSSPTAVAASPSTGAAARERRLLSDLWLLSAASFRRMGRIEQARGAIQEAEATDENNPGVWVQLGLYFAALGQETRAREALHKALFIAPVHIPAIVHLCRLDLSRAEGALAAAADAEDKVANMGDVDLASGMLEACTRGDGWDVPEAWHLLAKAYGLQGRVERERECLLFALELIRGRGVREIGASVGWVL